MRFPFSLQSIFNSFLTLPKKKEIFNTAKFMGKSRAARVWRPRNLLPTAILRKRNWNSQLHTFSHKEHFNGLRTDRRHDLWNLNMKNFIFWLEWSSIEMPSYWMICCLNWSSFTRLASWRVKQDEKQIKEIPESVTVRILSRTLK